MRRLLILLALFVLGGLPHAATKAQGSGQIFQVELARGVTPPAVQFVRRAIQEATAADAMALIVNIRNGAAVVEPALSLARDLEAAAVPVVVWIGPGPVQGGPAAALLLAAGDVVAMAPEATAGFALPLASTPGGFSLRTRQLVVDDVARELAGWQRARGRNVEWIERAVRSGAVIDAERARSLEPPLIDLVAATPDEMRTSLAGRRVTGGEGATRTLDPIGASTVVVAPTLLEWLAQTLAVPTVAFVIFVLGAIAIYLEFANPGIGVPGVAGGALVVAALYGFAQADVRPVAVALLAAGLVLIGLEHIVMSHGAVTLGGMILLVLGALWLVDPARSPGLAVAPLAVAATAALLVLAVVGLVTLALRVRRQIPVTGPEALVGQVAEVRRALDPEGLVYVAGALWSAWSDDGPLAPGELVEVAGIDRLRLYVRRLNRDSSP